MWQKAVIGGMGALLLVVITAFISSASASSSKLQENEVDIARLETKVENQELILREILDELRGIRKELRNYDARSAR